MLAFVLDFLNEFAKQTNEKLGVYKYNGLEDKSCKWLGPYQLENEAAYVGQWKNDMKNERGNNF